MVHSLYWVSSLTYAFVLMAIMFHDVRNNKKPQQTEIAFRILLAWVVFFCLQDTFWGLAAGELIKSHTTLFIASTIFHLSTVLTTFFWLNYILTYLGDAVKHRNIYLIVDSVVILFQVVLLIINMFVPTIFYVGEDGTYQTAFLRPIAFLNQYIVYLIIGIFTGVYAFSRRGAESKRYIKVFCFAFAPIMSGGLQFLYPDGPFYSLGYFLGCFIIHIYIVSHDRDVLRQLHHEMERVEADKRIAEQIEISHTDELTRLFNRRCYEEDLIIYFSNEIDEDLVYIAADVNGLKVVNDSLGHVAGDELIKGAATCFRRSLSQFGKIYRIGGDEFVALIFANEEKLNEIKENLNESINEWSGELVKKLSISIGVVPYAKYKGKTIIEIAKLADDKMYKTKTAYYMRTGYDRRGKQSAYSAICASYEKILKINLTDDSYEIIKMDSVEKNNKAGYSERLSVWLNKFGKTNKILAEDKAEYLTKTNIKFLREYFTDNSKSLNIFYHRNIDDVYRLVMMEMIPDEDFTEENKSLYLYVKDIDK